MSVQSPHRNKFLRTAAIVLLAGLLAAAAYEMLTAGRMETITESRKLLGEDATVQAVVRQGDERRGQEAVRQAMVEIERVDGLMNTQSSGSEFSQLVAAEHGQFVPLSPAMLEVIDQAGAPSWLMLLPAGAVKQADAGPIDLSAAARQYAAQQAIDSMKRTGIVGGSVKIGAAFEQFGGR